MITIKNYHLKAIMDWSEDSVYLFATPSITAKSMFFYVQEIGYFKTQARYNTERENLNSFLIVYTLSGTGYLKYEGKQYTLRPGDIFFIDCNLYQFYETNHTDLWEILWMHLDGGLCLNYYELFRSGGDPVISLPSGSPIPDILRNLIQLHQNKDIRTELISSNSIMNLLTELLLRRVQSEWKHQSNKMPELITKVANHIAKHFSTKIQLDMLAQQFAVNKYHLIREFKKYIGSTPNEYLILTRLTKAKELLKYSDFPIGEIAQSIGFDNVSHFVNTFKKHELLTPLSFRKQWRSR